MIEIKENKKKNINYLELDDELYKTDLAEIFYKQSLYCIQTNNLNDITVSYGMTKHIKEPNIIFTGNLISNGSPIFNLSNNKLIGVVGDKSEYYNHGILFNFLINDFINKDKYENIFKANNKYRYYTSLKNEINIKINVDKADINNNIYFLDNYEHEDNEGNIHLHDCLKELNELY